MAEIGTATVKITPVVDEDALSQIDASIREAVADALRKVADSLVAKPAAAAEPTPNAERFNLYYEPNGLGWAILDKDNPAIQARYYSDAFGLDDVLSDLSELRCGESETSSYEWVDESDPWDD